MIVQETTVSEDNRAIGSGGKDTFFGIVDGMSQCVDVISAMLYMPTQEAWNERCKDVIHGGSSNFVAHHPSKINRDILANDQ